MGAGNQEKLRVPEHSASGSRGICVDIAGPRLENQLAYLNSTQVFSQWKREARDR